jgi:putative endonuclease
MRGLPSQELTAVVCEKETQMPKEHNYYVYIMFNERAKATYIGMTNDIERRVLEHKIGKIKGYSQEKGTKKLAYYECFQYVQDAIAREKVLKTWKRVWKYRLIEEKNPEWKDLAEYLDKTVKFLNDNKL